MEIIVLFKGEVTDSGTNPINGETTQIRRAVLCVPGHYGNGRDLEFACVQYREPSGRWNIDEATIDTSKKAIRTVRNLERSRIMGFRGSKQ